MQRRAFLRGMVAAGPGLASAGGLGVEALIERSAFEITEFAVGPPTGGSNVMRIAWMSDMHRSRATPRWVLEEAAEACMKAEPHVILLGGDYVSSARDLPLVPECAEILGACLRIRCHLEKPRLLGFTRRR